MITICVVAIRHHTKLLFFVLVMRTFKFTLLEGFTYAVSWAIVTMLYITAARLVYFITGNLYLLTPFTHFIQPPSPVNLTMTIPFSYTLYKLGLTKFLGKHTLFWIKDFACEPDEPGNQWVLD